MSIPFPREELHVNCSFVLRILCDKRGGITTKSVWIAIITSFILKALLSIISYLPYLSMTYPTLLCIGRSSTTNHTHRHT